MVTNRSAPPGTIVPILCYRDTKVAIEWLCRVFGFRESLRWGPNDNQDAELSIGGGAIFVRGPRRPDGLTERSLRPPLAEQASHSVMVAVEDVDEHHTRAVAEGARVHRELRTYPVIGERQYSALDLDGHLWTFTQSVADVDPHDWAEVAEGR
jgi:uncharacterized glyoxalase superfamily protein PhnB